MAQDATWLSPTVGLGYGVQVKEGRTSDQELAQIKAAGLHYVRFVIPWAEVEKGEGTYRWGYFDQFIERLRAQGLQAVVVLGGGHPRYTGFIAAPEGNLDQTDKYLLPPSSPEAIAKFAAFAAQTVAHFGSQGIVWELWNEPDNDRFWPPHANVRAYIAVAGAACQAMRKADPQARIIGPGMADTPGRYGTDKPGFLGMVLRSPLGTCLDAVSVHPYRDGVKPPETVLDAYGKLSRFVQTYTPPEKRPLPVLSTEWGFTLTDTSEEEQAAYLLRSFMLNTMAGVPLSIWYEWRDARSGPDDPEAHFGLLKLDRTPKAAYKALAAFLPPLEGAWVEKRVKKGGPDDYLLLLRNGDGNYFLVVWTLDEKTGTKVFVPDEKGASQREYGLTFMPQRIDLGKTASSFTVLVN